MSKGNEGAVGGWRLRLTCTHITAIPGIFTLASITAAADTTTPDSPHEDKPTRQRFRPSSSHPRNQLLGHWTANFFFSQRWYHHADTMELFQISQGNLFGASLGQCLRVCARRAKRCIGLPRESGPPHRSSRHPSFHGSSLGLPVGEAQGC